MCLFGMLCLSEEIDFPFESLETTDPLGRSADSAAAEPQGAKKLPSLGQTRLSQTMTASSRSWPSAPSTSFC